MIKNLLIIIVIALVTAGLTRYFDNTPSGFPVPETPESSIKEGDYAPDFAFTDLTGKARKLSDLRGKKIILNFWASWCPPCIKEFPDLLAVAASDPQNIILLALSSDFEEAPMQRFLRKLERQNSENYNARNIMIAMDDNGAVTQGLFQTHLLPETILIDENGRMRRKVSGANWTRQDMLAMLKEF